MLLVLLVFPVPSTQAGGGGEGGQLALAGSSGLCIATL